MSRRNQSQLNLPPSLLANGTSAEAVLPKCTPPGIDAARELAAMLFDEALTTARITTSEVAYLFDVSESLVRRMRSRDARERASLVQMLLLPPAFHIAMQRAMNKRFGLGKAALLDLLDAVGRLAVNA